MDEIKDEDLKEWVKKHKDCFSPLTKELQQKTMEILAQFPHLIKIRSTSNSNADPFLIATAIIEHATIISDERKRDETSRDYHIPNVCEHYDIECITLQAFLDIIIE